MATVAAAAVALAAGVCAAVLATTGGTRAPAPAARTAAPSAAATGTGTAAPAPRRLPVGTIGRYAVARHSLTITDRTRPSLGPRVLPTEVLAPVIPAAAASGRLARGLFPLVVFAPGYRQCDQVYTHLLHQWASAGYVVAAVEFPRTNCHVAAPDEYDLANQPADMGYVIGRLVALSRRSRGALAGLVDQAEIAVAGHSDGGDTVAALAASTCCLDRKVDAAIVLAGAEWTPLPGRYFAAAAPPMLFVQGTADSWNPPPASVQLYRADTTGRRYYLELFGANHFTPYQGSGPPEPVVARVTVDFLNRFLAGQRGASAAMRRDGNVTGTAALTSGGRLPG